MSEAKKYTFEEFCQTVGAIVAEYGILGVYLFGSGACVDNRPDSDYNFRIKIPKGIQYGWKVKMLASFVCLSVQRRASSGCHMNDLLASERINLLKGA